MDLTALVIEDNVDMANYLRDVLEDHGFVAYTANQGSTSLQLVEEHQPDLVLLDLELPDVDGSSICATLTRDYPEIKIIIVTAQNQPSEVVAGLQLGADDFISKPIDSRELMARIKTRFRERLQNDVILTLNNLSLNQETHQVKRGTEEIKLSPQEFKLLRFLLINQGRVLTRDMILSRLWKTSPDIETRVVDVYIGYLRKKIDQQEPKLIHSVRGFGYALREE